MTVFASPTKYTGPLYKNLRVGLLGGSFDPAHQGHVDLSLAAIKQFQLDAVWWLVSPQNPLKKSAAQSVTARLATARKIVRHPKIIVSDLESQLGTRYTIDTIRQLKIFYPQTQFLFLTGSDNWPQLRQWKQWRKLAQEMEFAVFPRPPHSVRDLLCPTGRIALNWKLGRMQQNPLSSTDLKSTLME